MRKASVLLFVVFFFGSCSSEVKNKESLAVDYFDLKGFIEKEVKHLQVLNPEIEKTVTVNDKEEHQKLKNIDWKRELSAFTDADINKSAWIGEFKLHKLHDIEKYVTTNEKIPVKLLEIVYRGKKVYKIQVINKNSNILYISNDTLSYYPDSLYEMKKSQHIKLLNEKKYRIIGRFK